jgi:hypothetical protein
MHTFTPTLLAALLLLPASPLRAQSTVDPTGHWEGTLQIQDAMMAIEIDLTKNAKGELAGTFGQPAQQVKGLPLSSVAVEGRGVTILFKGGQQPTTFQAIVSDDGKSMNGTAAQGGYSIPFTLTGPATPGSPRCRKTRRSARSSRGRGTVRSISTAHRCG